MIEYNNYELLELFENEPQIIGDEEVGIYNYKHLDAHGFTFEMYFSSYDQYCILTLSHKDFKKPFFSICFEKIDKIECKKDKLIIQQRGNSKNIVVYFKPNYSLVLENRIP